MNEIRKITVSDNYYSLNIKKIEKKHKAKYLGDFCILDKNGGWTDTPVSIFYVKEPDTSKGHSHYFGIYTQRGNVYITKGDSAFETPLIGILSDDGELIISCYRRHYIKSEDKSVFIDGGRDYNRYSFTNKLTLMQVRVIHGEFIVENEYKKLLS